MYKMITIEMLFKMVLLLCVDIASYITIQMNKWCKITTIYIAQQMIGNMSSDIIYVEHNGVDITWSYRVLMLTQSKLTTNLLSVVVRHNNEQSPIIKIMHKKNGVIKTFMVNIVTNYEMCTDTYLNFGIINLNMMHIR